MKTKFVVTRNGLKIEEYYYLIDAVLSIRDKIIEQSEYLTYTEDNNPSLAIVMGKRIPLTPLYLREVELKDGVYKIHLQVE